MLSAVKGPNCVDDRRLLRLGKFRVNRQRQRLARQGLGNRERAGGVAQIGEALLQVERDWVIHFAADAGGVEVRAWPIREVAGARLAESRDDEGGAVFRVEVVLGSGDVVPISLLWTHGREPAEAVVRRLQEALAMPPPSGSR